MLERAKDYLGLQIGSYRLLRPLGEGTFSQVYLGEHIYLKTQSAIKLLRIQLSPEVRENFLHEAQTIAKLEHPNIIRVFDYGVADETPFLVMNYAPNGSLRQRYSIGTRLSLDEILPILKQIAPALDYAHQMHLIHRDVKPENILIGVDDRMFLSDFGLVLEAHSQSSQTLGKAAGTVLYMAPEQFSGNVRYASDQYALGIIVYQWLCGECPFNGTFAEIISQHLYTPLPSLSDRISGVAPIIDRILLKALAKDPAERYETTVAFVDALQKAFDSPLAHIDLYDHISEDPVSEFPSDVTAIGATSLAVAGVVAYDIDESLDAQPTALDQQGVVMPMRGSGSRAASARSSVTGFAQRITPFWRIALALLALCLVIGGSLGIWYGSSHSSPGAQHALQTPSVSGTHTLLKTPVSHGTAHSTVTAQSTSTIATGSGGTGVNPGTPVGSKSGPTPIVHSTAVHVATPVPPTAASTPTPVVSCLSGSQTEFIFTSYKRGPDPDPGVLTLTNCGGSSGWNASTQTNDGNNWLSVVPASGSLAANASEQIVIAVSHKSLPHGTYQGSILFTDGSASFMVTVINVVNKING